MQTQCLDMEIYRGHISCLQTCQFKFGRTLETDWSDLIFNPRISHVPKNRRVTQVIWIPVVGSK